MQKNSKNPVHISLIFIALGLGIILASLGLVLSHAIFLAAARANISFISAYLLQIEKANIAVNAFSKVLYVIGGIFTILGYMLFSGEDDSPKKTIFSDEPPAPPPSPQMQPLAEQETEMEDFGARAFGFSDIFSFDEPEEPRQTAGAFDDEYLALSENEQLREEILNRTCVQKP